jgi:GT2 family glycosyltransferase/glycosyltransferase involved in cell wall biosynthesis
MQSDRPRAASSSTHQQLHRTGGAYETTADHLKRDMALLQDLLTRALLSDKQNAERLQMAELRLAQCAALLMQAWERADGKTLEQLLEQAQREVIGAHAELSRQERIADSIRARMSERQAGNGGSRDNVALLPPQAAPELGDDLEANGPLKPGQTLANLDRLLSAIAKSEAHGVDILADAWRVDIVICVHNALQDVARCLMSVIRNTEPHHRVIVVDDGSSVECAALLREFAKAYPITLLRNYKRKGYTKAANQGLRASTGDLVVLLNSDTIVPPQWLERLIECAQSDERIGIVGPLSNAASYQSVPERFDPSGDWAVNPLPPGWSVDDVSAAVAEISERVFPRVSFINGFCFAIKRAVIDSIGYFDKKRFPEGYGEENDYCLRAAAAGFELAIADHAYVYHAKSRSYSHQRRQKLGRSSNWALQRKHSSARIAAGQNRLWNEPALARMRQELRHLLAVPRIPPVVAPAEPKPLSVLFLVPVGGGGGGVHSVVQETAGMRRLGINARVAVQTQYLPRFHETYSALDPDQLFLDYGSLDELMSHAAGFTTVVGTLYTSMTLVAAINAVHPEVIPAYYVQDYEPLFFPRKSAHWDAAAESYTLVPGAVLFAKTQWLCDIVRERHGVEVHKVSPSIDHDVYYPPLAREANSRVRVAAMIRPRSPRRGAWRTLLVLRGLAREFGTQVDIHTFGCTDEDMSAEKFASDFRFTNHGPLLREQVADLLRESDVFLDLSDYQAFGRTGLEAMACGCAVVLPVLGGTSEYAVHGENALLVDTSDIDACYDAARALIEHAGARQRLQEAGLATAAEYSIERAARSELDVLTRALLARSERASHPVGGAYADSTPLAMPT